MMNNYYHQYHYPYQYPVNYSVPRQGMPTGPFLPLWTPPEAAQNIAQYRGQYIRTAITGYGVVYAQLTDYNATTGIVDLNVYFTPGKPPSFMRVNRVDLTGIVPLGFQPPPEILAPPVMPTMPTMPTSPTKPWYCWKYPWLPQCQ
ncbi:MAG: hypothetical protein ACQEWW_26380 [Bacillota bacterium]